MAGSHRQQILVPFLDLEGHSYRDSIQAAVWADVVFGCRYPNAIKLAYIYKNLR